MQQPTLETLPGSKVKLQFKVSLEEAKPYLEEAALAMSAAKPLPGFRPGKAPYSEVVKAFGEMRVWETALERIVRARYLRAVLDLDIDTVGSPEIQVDKLTPGADIEFTVIAPVAPTVSKLADYSAKVTDYASREVTEEDIQKALEDLRRMQRKEVLTDEAATKDDLVVIDMDMMKDHVALEGGTGRDYRIYLSEDNYIPGFAEKLVGIKAGEERTFTLKFPEVHYQKHLSGLDIDFTAKAKSVFKLEVPPIDDDFAKSLGQKSLDELKARMRENLSNEEEERGRQKSEIAMLEKLVDASSFSEVPELLVNEELKKMLSEMERAVEERGMEMNDYLMSIKKTKDELRLEFAPQAIRRIKTATLIKDIAKREKITVNEDELDHEIDHVLGSIPPEDKETRERVISPEYREYVSILLRNQKTLEFLKIQCINGYKPRPVHTHDDGHGGHDDHDHGDHEGHDHDHAGHSH